MNNKIVVFCKYRELRPAGGVICPGGIWTCTNPNGHCSCVATCGIQTVQGSGVKVQGFEDESTARNLRHGGSNIERSGLFLL